MTLQFREARKEDLDVICSLLQESGLPTESLGSDSTTFYIAEDGERTVGIAGFEFYGDEALLRSVAIKPDVRGRGLGSQLVDHMLQLAREKGVRNVVLLTETARDFFLKKKFEVIDRSWIDNDLMKQSSEFAFACPTTAVCMILKLL